jgi:hypothetical protein
MRPERAGGGAERAAAGGHDEPPPVLGRWSRLYLLVALELALVIAALYWLTRRFA